LKVFWLVNCPRYREKTPIKNFKREKVDNRKRRKPYIPLADDGFIHFLTNLIIMG